MDVSDDNTYNADLSSNSVYAHCTMQGFNLSYTIAVTLPATQTESGELIVDDGRHADHDHRVRRNDSGRTGRGHVFYGAHIA